MDHQPRKMPSFTCLPKASSCPPKGETGNYQEDDYILDANGDRTPILKDGTDGQISYDDIDFDTDNLGPTGFGMAIDLGATYKLNDEWTFSASLLDLGFISWKNTTKGTMSKDFTFNGFSDISVKDDGTDNNKKLDTQVDELVDDLADLAKFDKAGEGLKRTTALAATLHLGAQYTLPAYDRLSFGFLSTTRMQGKHSWTEARVSANVAPLSWFEASVNYALSNFGSDAGIMLNFHPRGFNFFIGADVPMCKYEPAYYAPISRAAVNINMGINFTFGPKHKRKYKTVETNHSEFINQKQEEYEKRYIVCMFAMLPLAAWAGEVKVTKPVLTLENDTLTHGL